MLSWTDANMKLRAERDAMDEAKRLKAHAEVDAAAGAARADCGCTAGSICWQNSACPRRAEATIGL